MYYFVFKFFGYWGISSLFAFFGLATSLLLFQLLKSLNVPILTSSILTLTATSIASFRWPSRPEIMGPFFTMVLIYLLVVKQKHLKLVPFIFLVWGIFYGASAFLGIGIFLFWILTSNSLNKKTSVIFATSVIFSLLNGYGLSSFFYIVQIRNIGPHIGEWLPLFATIYKAPPTVALFYRYIVIAYLLFTALYTISLLLMILKNRKIVINNLFLFGLSISIFAAFYMNRFISLAAFFATPTFGLIWLKSSRGIRKILLTGLILTCSLATVTRFNRIDFGSGLKESIFQTKIVDFMKTNNLKGNIFSSQEIGSFLNWYLPDSKVFVDTRDDLFLNTLVIEDLDSLARERIGIIEILNKYGANIIVGHITSNIYKPIFSSESWKILLTTDEYFIAVKTD